MTSPKQKAANRLNSIKSTGPRTQDGIRSASLNAVKHRLSLPVTEQFFNEEIAAVSALVDLSKVKLAVALAVPESLKTT